MQIQGKRDPAQEEQVKQWIEAVIGEKFNAAKSFEENLKDGIILCKLINKIRPGSVKKIQESTMPFKQMENIQAFQEGIKKYGVAENEVFQTVDLYEKKDINQVTLCLLALTRAVSTIWLKFTNFSPKNL